MIHSSIRYLRFAGLCLLLIVSSVSAAEKDDLTDFDQKVKAMAEKCRDEVTREFDILLSANRLKAAQLFDTFYIPIPDTNPQKFSTQYDRMVDQTIREILDKYLALDNRLLFVVAIDKNGYVAQPQFQIFAAADRRSGLQRETQQGQKDVQRSNRAGCRQEYPTLFAAKIQQRYRRGIVRPLRADHDARQALGRDPHRLYKTMSDNGQA
ncbi:MAG: Methyl-accepting chemotaxis sensory transducer [uncultured bacterium]|nr:MAG: Methyl-accepting chemotaxis sensory transducer [uncultured bacterium]